LNSTLHSFFRLALPFQAAMTTNSANKEARERCWKHRDEFFACLQKRGAIVQVEDASDSPEECEQFRKPFLGSCSPSWVKHFLIKRLYQQRQEELAEPRGFVIEGKQQQQQQQQQQPEQKK